jgi:hypothetical protein
LNTNSNRKQNQQEKKRKGIAPERLLLIAKNESKK